MAIKTFTAPAAATLIRRELQRGDVDFAIRTMLATLQQFRIASEAERREFLEPPGSTGSMRWDTLFAALVGMECDGLTIRRPLWTRPDPLPEEWVVTASKNPTAAWVARTKDGTPAELARLNIWIHVRDLVTV